MRTLKFRIWNTKGKCFYTDEHVKANFFNYIEKMPDEPIMQFTGLLDRHGKEIYEGDVVKSRIDDETDQWVIDMSDFGWFRSPIGHAFDNSWIEFEIIGNIYESPELAK